MNADKFVVRGQTYDVLSPATFGDYIETVGAACINPSGYAENKLFLAYDDNVQKLFRATAAIAYSELLIKDTNCEPTTMAEALANALSAGGVSYDNTDSGLTASNVQDAIDEVNGDVETVNSDLTSNIDAQNYYGAKNRFRVTQASEVASGVTYTNSLSDGTITLNATNSTEAINYTFDNGWNGENITDLRGKTVIISDGVTVDAAVQLKVNFGSGWNAVPKKGELEITIPNDAISVVPVLSTESGVAYDNVVVKPMLRLVGTDSTFVPYAKTNHELSYDSGWKAATLNMAAVTGDWIAYRILGKICFVVFSNVTPITPGNNVEICNDLPKANHFATGACVANNTNITNSVFIEKNNTVLKVHAGSSLGLYGDISYIIAD